MNKVLSRAIFIIGWLLSPLTWWNDTFVNLPLAYLCASVYHLVFPGDFAAYLVASYWFTNILGIAMLYIGARDLFIREFRKEKRLSWILTIIAYSLLVVVLARAGIVRPFVWTIR